MSDSDDDEINWMEEQQLQNAIDASAVEASAVEATQ